ncbi:M50 family metallopeptidase [Alkalihalobacillus sp. MEB130]|uniref:M50 family metallopeptidase n=1 Tax=Alkalihalobacillus sp. MEB130 TaxID=2976704 RepID=UPI0028DE699C|nr:M50 family metallopeptidase [Alkalihalobacillus sp. MEB130]MDT8861559.1 M50 family metallopeptidase [Alkalihalobacillus sp. MEB130]
MNQIFVYILVAVIISFIPIIRSLFGTIHTLIHESGHAIATLLTSGKVYSISLFSTTDGVAYTASTSRFRSIIVAYAGYTFASFMALISFYLITSGNVMLLFYVFLSFAIINLCLWVRNFFGILWLLFYVIGCSFMIYFQLDSIKEMVVHLLASIILVQSVLASIAIFLLSITHSKSAGDATNLQKLTYIPAFIWGLLFLSQSIFSSYYIFRYFLT